MADDIMATQTALPVPGPCYCTVLEWGNGRVGIHYGDYWFNDVRPETPSACRWFVPGTWDEEAGA